MKILSYFNILINMGSKTSKPTNNPFIQQEIATSESLGWNNVNTDAFTENNIKKTITKDGMEIIELDIDFQNTTESEQLENVFSQMNNIIQKEENTESSPFISSELYNKIMNGGKDNTSSAFISTEVYKKLMNGGGDLKSLDSSSSSSSDDSDDSTSDSSEILSLAAITTDGTLSPQDIKKLIPHVLSQKKKKEKKKKTRKK